MSNADSSKSIVNAFYESYNQHDLETSWERFIAPDLANHVMGGAYDREGWLHADMQLFPAFADFTMTVLDQVAEGDKVATRYRLGGTQSGEFFGIPASGNTAYLTGTAVDRVEDGKIVEHWGDLDFGSFLQALQAPAASASV